MFAPVDLKKSSLAHFDGIPERDRGTKKVLQVSKEFR
jgi:hypothetical protein